MDDVQHDKERLPSIAVPQSEDEAGQESGEEEVYGGLRRHHCPFTRVVSVLGRMWHSTNKVKDMIECSINTAQSLFGPESQASFYMLPGLVDKLESIYGGFPVYKLQDHKEVVKGYR